MIVKFIFLYLKVPIAIQDLNDLIVYEKSNGITTL